MMYWKVFCREKIFENQFGRFVKISGPDFLTQEAYWIYLKYDDYLAVQNGVHFHIAFKNYTSETLDFLFRGNAPKYQCPITQQQKISRKVYVTNASANSVVFYAGAYLNGLGLSYTVISKLREKYNIGNFERRYFTADELRESFINQSAFFLSLYRKMNEHDRFENFVEGLDDERFKQVFRRYENVEEVKKNYNRRIFHDKFECASMRSHYEEVEFHENTGVFVEQDAIEKPEFYVVEESYLQNLNMRICRMCESNYS